MHQTISMTARHKGQGRKTKKLFSFWLYNI